MVILFLVTNPALAVTVASQLHATGYECFTVTGRDSCIEQLRRSKPDLLLLDIESTGASSRRVLAEIKHEEAFQSLPRFVIGPASEAHIGETYGSGADMYFTTPLDLDELLRCISLIARNRT